MATLFLPYNIIFTRLDNVAAPSYPVDIAVSSARIETRTLLVDKASDASISLVVDNETDESMGALWDFYQVCRGNHRSFEVRSDHNLYDLVPEFMNTRFLPLWRFDSELSFKLAAPSIYLYETSIALKNVEA